MKTCPSAESLLKAETISCKGKRIFFINFLNPMTNQKALWCGLLSPVILGVIILYSFTQDGFSSLRFTITLMLLASPPYFIYAFLVLLIIFITLLSKFLSLRRGSSNQSMSKLIFWLAFTGGFQIVILLSYLSYLSLWIIGVQLHLW